MGPNRLTIIICPTSSDIAATEAFRPLIMPSSLNGLREPSMVMTDKIVAVRRERLRTMIGQLADEDTRKLEQALMLVPGLGGAANQRLD